MNYGNLYYFTDRSGNNSFPSVKSNNNNYTKQQSIREIIGNSFDLQSKFGKPVLDSETVRQLERQINEYKEIDFMGWAMNQVDGSAPEKLKFWTQNFPELFRDKLENIKQETEIQKKVAMISIFGPQNMEDLRLVYDVNQEQKDVSNFPIYQLNKTGLGRQNNLHTTMQQTNNLFPNVQRNALFNMNSIFDPETNHLMTPESDRNRFSSILGNRPNESHTSLQYAMNKGLGWFF